MKHHCIQIFLLVYMAVDTRIASLYFFKNHYLSSLLLKSEYYMPLGVCVVFKFSYALSESFRLLVTL